MRLGTGVHITAPRHPAGPGLLVHDIFDEATNTRLETHVIAPVNRVAAVWSASTEGAILDDEAFTIEGGTGWLKAPGTGGPHYATHDVAQSDLALEFILGWSGNDFYGGAVIRYVDPENTICLDLLQPADPADSAVWLVAQASGFPPETIGAVGVPDITATDHLWRVECSGTLWAVYLDGELLFDGISTHHLTETHVGVRTDDGGAVDSLVKDWKVFSVES